MAISSYKARVKLANGQSEVITVQASSISNAKAILSTYGTVMSGVSKA